MSAVQQGGAPQPMVMAAADPAAAVSNVLGAYNAEGSKRYMITNGREANTINAALYDNGGQKIGSFVLRRGATFAAWDGVFPPDFLYEASQNVPVHFEFEPSFNAFNSSKADGSTTLFMKDHASSGLTIFTGPSGKFPGKISAKKLEGCWCACSYVTCCPVCPVCLCDATAVPDAEEDEYTHRFWGCVGMWACCCPDSRRGHYVRDGKTNTFRLIGNHDGRDRQRINGCLEFWWPDGTDGNPSTGGNPRTSSACGVRLLGPRNGRRLAEYVGPWEPCLIKWNERSRDYDICCCFCFDFCCPD